MLSAFHTGPTVRNPRIHSLFSVAIILSVMGSMFLSACSCSPHPSVEEQEARRRASIQEEYLRNGLGSQAIDLNLLSGLSQSVASQIGAATLYPSPYLLSGAFSLDPKWYPNRIRIMDLPEEPINLQEALGYPNNAELVPDLKAVYYPGDELFLFDGSKLSFKVNDSLEVVECLNNPSQNIQGDEECDSSIRNQTGNRSMYVIERDQYNTPGFPGYDQTTYSATKFSGTVIYAKRIVLAGYINTQGYDLVLVADEIEAWPGAEISTTPLDRPHDDGGSGISADLYGRGGSGYDAGDVILLARRISGKLDIRTAGGRGQLGRDDQDLPCQEVCRVCKNDSSGHIPDKLTNCQPCPLELLEEPGWVVDVGYRCSGTQGLGGQGGDAGQVTIIGSDLQISFTDINLSGGPPGLNGNYPGPDPYGPDAVIGVGPVGDLEVEMAFAEEQSQGHDWLMNCLLGQEDFFAELDDLCAYEDHMPQAELYDCDNAGTDINCGEGYYCYVRDRDWEYSPNPPQWQLSFLEWCDQYASGMDGWKKYYCPIDPNGVCPETIGIVHRHCQLDPDLESMYDCVQYPESFIRKNQSRNEFGQQGSISWYQADVPILLKPLEEGIADQSMSFEQGTLHQPVGAGSMTGYLSNLDYARAVHALAPRSAELLILKADYLYRSMTDSDLNSKDEIYAENLDINPNGENRIYKSEYFYDSVLYFDPEAVGRAINGEAPFSMEISPENPFRDLITLAYARKQSLVEGRNYFGFSPHFYFYAPPEKIWSYMNDMTSLSEDSRLSFQNARDNLSAILASRNALVVEMDLDYGYEIDVYKSELQYQEEKLKYLAFQLDQTLKRIEENSQTIFDTYGNDVEINTCEPELLDDEGNVVPPTIKSEIAFLEECSQRKPCDPGCWYAIIFQFAEKIISAVGSVYGLFEGADWLEGIVNLANALENIQTVNIEQKKFLDSVRIAGEYVSVLTGEENNALVKGIEETVDIVEEIEEIVGGFEDLESPETDQILEDIGNIAIFSDQTADGLQQNLTEIYALQFMLEELEDGVVVDRTQAIAHASSLVDLIKYNQALNREIPELQQEHILAAQEFALAEVEWETLNAKITHAEAVQEALSSTASHYDNDMVSAQQELDEVVRHANLIQDRLLLLRYFYTRSEDFMYLNPPSDFAFTQNLLLDEEALQYRLDNSDEILDRLVSAIKTNQDGFVWHTISPARYDLRDTGHNDLLPIIDTRTNSEIELALCPEFNQETLLAPEECTLTFVAYDSYVLSQLQETGKASFQFYPDSLPSFRRLSEGDKLDWNPNFSIADFTYERDGFGNQAKYQKRVVDVGAVIYTDPDYGYPRDILPTFRIEHGPIATFLKASAEGDIRESFIFPKTAMQDVCVAVNALGSSDETDCEGFEYFYVIDNITPIDNSSVDRGYFSTYHIFGTSIRDTWTIDIESFLSAFHNEHERNEFWAAFRGIQIWVYYVSIE